MKYFYEYKETNGCKVAGHNLEKVIISENNVLFIQGIENNRSGYTILLNMKDIEYLKITPMKDDDYEERNSTL